MDSEDGNGSIRGRGVAWASVLVMMVCVLVWLWPIGIGGKMPVGGDVTQFSLGPMSVLGRALRSGRLPLWNDLWGYGFPGIGESQMGVFYPVHWVLYGLFSLELAYTLSLVGHTLWGAIGVWFAARRFGVSPIGAALSGFSWTACGFFAIHLPHQWGYTTGCWMPWAWGLGWSLLNGTCRRGDAPKLALVLALQLLPGHFQLAFCTQVGLVLMWAEQALEKVVVGDRRIRGLLLVPTALAAAFLLSAAQIWPTLRLAGLAAQRRDFEYLSGFAATPLHLITFVAPGLFEISPLWRPLVWDPFHTSPEEYLGYVGLAPLFLALFALGSLRRSGAVRCLGVVVAVTLVLALGPYVSGFRTWSEWPGFSFFRAPARWTLATSLGLCLLAGLGMDRLADSKRARSAIVGFSLASVLAIGLTLLAVESAFFDDFFSHAFSPTATLLDALPWSEENLLDRIHGDGARPNRDPRVAEAWARQGVALREAPVPVFVTLRRSIYRQELAGSAVLLIGLVVIVVVLGRRAWLMSAALVVLTVFDLAYLTKPHRVDLGPIQSLARQSPVLAKLASEPAGTRTVDALRNMPMVAGLAPISAYRTLDLPALESLTSLAGASPTSPEERNAVLSAMRFSGAGIRVFDPFEPIGSQAEWPGSWSTIEDRALAGWRFGVDWVDQQNARARTFRVYYPAIRQARGWLVPLTARTHLAILGSWTGNPFDVLHALEGAVPIQVAHKPESRLLTFRAEGPAILVVNELADPEWEAVWIDKSGERPAIIERAFGRANHGAWMAIQVPSEGDWILQLRYRGRDVYVGMCISAVAFAVFGLIVIQRGRARRESS